MQFLARNSGEMTATTSISHSWMRSISHGEVIRKLTDQTLMIDVSESLRFLYQGLDPAKDEGDYNALPWRLALLTQQTTETSPGLRR
ncbi:uncharacterized protein P884DRAFT_299881 [Thermothelomyces heterothallicus CBS 202.75]|uniref:uncharacterized protein n=1 Tax=Thermothelomyces heterothallicus CBS 202.75 TaxID=1149848 RepID=UPI003742C933